MILIRTLQLGIIASAMAILALPIVQMTFNIVPAYTIFDGRRIASWKDAPAYAPTEQFTKFATNWFRDNYGMREWLIRKEPN
jgi:hypothetical protein